MISPLAGLPKIILFLKSVNELELFIVTISLSIKFTFKILIVDSFNEIAFLLLTNIELN